MEKIAEFRFYEELNDFLPKHLRKISFNYEFTGNPTVKGVIESLGVPHSEIDLILVNGNSVNFEYRLQQHDRVAVYPVFEAIDISNAISLRPKPLRRVKFILDSHLGRLAKYLRICGFDTFYQADLDDQEIVELALKEKRIIVTKDKDLLKNKKVTHGYWVRGKLPKQQFVETIKRFDLINKIKFVSRCLICNSLLRSIKKEEVKHVLPAKTAEYYDYFYICPKCKRIYWKGSHYENMKSLLDLIR